MRIPWWIFAFLAAISFFFLSWLAGSPVQKGSPGTAVMSGVVKGLATVGKLIVPLLLLLLAALTYAVSAKERQRQRSAAFPRIDPTYFRDTREVPQLSLTLELLRQIDWKLFEEVCAEYLRLMGFVARTQSHGPDGGIDITLAMPETPDKVVGLVQCKQWASPVGPKVVRELLGVMTDAKVSEGMFITTSTFNVEAQVFGESNGIDLIDGERLMHLIKKHPSQAQARLLSIATQGDYLTPTCAACGVKMVRRNGRQGSSFWGCANYPRCKLTIDR